MQQEQITTVTLKKYIATFKSFKSFKSFIHPKLNKKTTKPSCRTLDLFSKYCH